MYLRWIKTSTKKNNYIRKKVKLSAYLELNSICEGQEISQWKILGGGGI